MSTSTRLSALVAVCALAAAACGGDDATSVLSGTDAPSTDAPATDPPATDPPPTDPPATDPPATDPPPTDPPATDPPATDPPATDPPATDPPDDLPDPAFCGASAQFYVEAQALREIGEDDDEAARRLFDRMQVSLSASLLNAPDEASAEAPRRMEQAFTVLLPAFESVDYDADALDTLPNGEEVEAAFEEFVAILASLEGFLDDTCGIDLAGLATQSADLAAEVASSSTTGDSVPTTDGAPTDLQSVSDDSGTITVDVPATWTDVRGEPDGELRQLFAAPDVDAFLAAYSAPGVAILAGDAPAGNGAEAAEGAMDGFVASAEADGCSQNISAPYDDGVYTGERRVYSCPGSTSNVNIAAGTNANGDIFWLLAIVTVEGDGDTVATITDTFFVD